MSTNVECVLREKRLLDQRDIFSEPESQVIISLAVKSSPKTRAAFVQRYSKRETLRGGIRVRFIILVNIFFIRRRYIARYNIALIRRTVVRFTDKIQPVPPGLLNREATALITRIDHHPEKNRASVLRSVFYGPSRSKNNN